MVQSSCVRCGMRAIVLGAFYLTEESNSASRFASTFRLGSVGRSKPQPLDSGLQVGGVSCTCATLPRKAAALAVTAEDRRKGPNGRNGRRRSDSEMALRKLR